MDSKEWTEAVSNFNKQHEGYANFVLWMKDKCFPNIEFAKREYEATTGRTFTA